MSEFKKGQLVATRDNAGESWALVKYNHKADHKHSVERIADAVLLAQNYNYKECLPAEEVWPDIFLGWERRAREQSDHAVEMESELVQRLRRQIAWLCERLEDFGKCTGAQRCPLISYHACAYCWEQASLKAVEGGKDE